MTETRNLREIYYKEVIDLKTELEFRGISIDPILERKHGNLDYWQEKETELRDILDEDNYWLNELKIQKEEEKLLNVKQNKQELSND